MFFGILGDEPSPETMSSRGITSRCSILVTSALSRQFTGYRCECRRGPSQSQSQSCFTTDDLPQITSSWRQTPWDPRPVFFFQMNTCFRSPYVIFSLTRRRVCRLQLLLTLASAVILRSESRRPHDNILLSQIWDFHNLVGQVSVFISPRNRVTQ
jgi:hypothetical protein